MIIDVIIRAQVGDNSHISFLTEDGTILVVEHLETCKINPSHTIIEKTNTSFDEYLSDFKDSFFNNNVKFINDKYFL